MKTIEERYIDKSSWGDGPWQHEPDRVQWLDPQTGLPCLITRSEMGGNLCGYVGVPRTHPAYEKDYNNVEASVHGGLTYADHCAGRICHVVEPGEDDDIWWLGFDCAHGWDCSPAFDARYGLASFFDRAYRDMPYVKDQIEKLALQLAAIAS